MKIPFDVDCIRGLVLGRYCAASFGMRPEGRAAEPEKIEIDVHGMVVADRNSLVEESRDLLDYYIEVEKIWFVVQEALGCLAGRCCLLSPHCCLWWELGESKTDPAAEGGRRFLWIEIRCREMDWAEASRKRKRVRLRNHSLVVVCLEMPAKKRNSCRLSEVSLVPLETYWETSF